MCYYAQYWQRLGDGVSHGIPSTCNALLGNGMVRSFPLHGQIPSLRMFNCMLFRRRNELDERRPEPSPPGRTIYTVILIIRRTYGRK